MSKNEPEISYALLDGRIVHVSTVARGRACGCVCTSCGRPLIARQGPELTWHFAHETESSCRTAPETALHLLAKQVIADAREIWLPCVSIKAKSGHEYKIVEAERVVFESVLKEKDLGDVQPDLIGIVGERKIFIEIAVTHFIKSDKMEKIRARDAETIEINLQGLNRSIEEATLRENLCRDLERKEWIHHPIVARVRDEYERKDLERIEALELRWQRESEEFWKKRRAEAEDRERRRQWGIKKRREEEEARLERIRVKHEAEEAERKAKAQEEEERMRPIREAEKLRWEENQRRRQQEHEEWTMREAERRTEEKRQQQFHRAEQERVMAEEQAKYQADSEAAYQKRREYDLGLWSPTDQTLYRRCIDQDKMTHQEACAAVTAARVPGAEERAAEYDRTHRSRFKFNPRTGRGGYV
jgi:hypothetical protein